MIREDTSSEFLPRVQAKRLKLTGSMGIRKLKKESKTQFKETFYEFYEKLNKSNLRLQETYIQDILNEISLKNVQVLSIHQTAELFEKLFEKSINNRKYGKKNWAEDEVEYLVSLVAYYTNFSNIDFRLIDEEHWKTLAAMFPTKESNQMNKKWLSLFKNNIAKHPWSAEEDALLRKLIEEIGTDSKWIKIAEELNSRNQQYGIFRKPKQCRERWINHLDPSIKKGEWSEDDDIKFLILITKEGKKWAKIAKLLGNRTENSVKNRWSSLTKHFSRSVGSSVLYKKEETSIKSFARSMLQEMKKGQNIEIPEDIDLDETDLKSENESSCSDSEKDELTFELKKSESSQESNVLDGNLPLKKTKLTEKQKSHENANQGRSASSLSHENSQKQAVEGSGSLLHPKKSTRHSQSALEGLCPNLSSLGTPADPLRSIIQPLLNPIQGPLLIPSQQTVPIFSNNSGLFSNNQLSNQVSMQNEMQSQTSNLIRQIPPNDSLYRVGDQFSNKQLNVLKSAPSDVGSNRQWQIVSGNFDYTTLQNQLSMPGNQIYMGLIDMGSNKIQLLSQLSKANCSQVLPFATNNHQNGLTTNNSLAKVNVEMPLSTLSYSNQLGYSYNLLDSNFRNNIQANFMPQVSVMNSCQFPKL